MSSLVIDDNSTISDNYAGGAGGFVFAFLFDMRLVILFIAVTNFAAQAKDLKLNVVPFGQGPLNCTIETLQNPPVVENDLIRFRVLVIGGAGPYEWRLPLYKSNNGYNDVSMARVGKATLNDDKSFQLDLNVQDLEKTGDKENLELTVRSRERFEARCSTPAKVVRQLAKSAPAKELVIEAGARR